MLLWLLLALPIHDLAPVPGAPRVEARLCDDVEQYRGFFTLRTGPSKHYFYWHFAARVAPESAPTVLWLTGGPGCSSEVALFGENGPCKVNADGASTTRNPFSWNERANLLYVDQPTGTGFSYGTGYDHDETGVANDMFDFLQQFFEAVRRHVPTRSLRARVRARAPSPRASLSAPRARRIVRASRCASTPSCRAIRSSSSASRTPAITCRASHTACGGATRWARASRSPSRAWAWAMD